MTTNDILAALKVATGERFTIVHKDNIKNYHLSKFIFYFDDKLKLCCDAGAVGNYNIYLGDFLDGTVKINKIYINLTTEQRNALEALKLLGFKYIGSDCEYNAYVYAKYKDDLDYNVFRDEVYIPNNIFNFLNTSDGVFYNIDDLLKGGIKLYEKN